jgi:hypothetical protein
MLVEAASSWSTSLKTESRARQKLITGVLYAATLVGALIGGAQGYRVSGWDGVPVGLMVMALVGGLTGFPIAGLVYLVAVLFAWVSKVPRSPRR